MLVELRGMAGAAIHFAGRVMRQLLALEVRVTAGTAEAAVNGSRKFLRIDEQRNGFSIARGAHAFVAMAGQTLRAGLVRPGSSGSHGTTQNQKGENSHEERRNDYSRTSAPLPVHNLWSKHLELSVSLLDPKTGKHFRVFLLNREQIMASGAIVGNRLAVGAGV